MAMTFYDPVRAQSFTTPLPMGDRGKYHYDRQPELAQNGRGEAVVAQIDGALWTWDWMTKDDFNWWAVTLLQGAGSLFCSGATLIYIYTQDKTTVLTSCVVHRPKFAHFGNGRYVDVSVEFTNIIW